MKAPLFDQTGKKKGEVTLPKEIFEVKAAEGLIHQYLVYQQANERMPIAHVLSRADVRGGGRKPRPQKGSGRSRQGSTRNVHMRGGGVAFGPKKWQNFSVMMPKKMRRKALFALLTGKAEKGLVLALDKFELDKPKTKTFAELIAKLPETRNVLVVANRSEEMLRRSSKNLASAKSITSSYLNPHDLLKFETILFTEMALKDLETTYSK